MSQTKQPLADYLDELTPCYQIPSMDRVKYVHIEGKHAYGCTVYVFEDDYDQFSTSALEATQWLMEADTVYYIEEWGDSDQ